MRRCFRTLALVEGSYCRLARSQRIRAIPRLLSIEAESWLFPAQRDGDACTLPATSLASKCPRSPTPSLGKLNQEQQASGWSEVPSNFPISFYFSRTAPGRAQPDRSIARRRQRRLPLT